MDYNKLIRKIEQEAESKVIAQNYANALISSHPELIGVVEAWLNGSEPEFTYQGITLSVIREKENCSYLQSLLKMQLIMSSPALAAGYLRWRPINKDVKR